MLTFILLYLLFGFFIFWITFFGACFIELKDFEDFTGRTLTRIGYTFLYMYYEMKGTKFIPFIIAILIETVIWPIRLWATYTESGRKAYQRGLETPECNKIIHMVYKDEEAAADND